MHHRFEGEFSAQMIPISPMQPRVWGTFSTQRPILRMLWHILLSMEFILRPSR